MAIWWGNVSLSNLQVVHASFQDEKDAPKCFSEVVSLHDLLKACFGTGTIAISCVFRYRYWRIESDMHAHIAERREELAELCRRYDVIRLEIFGSAARATDFDPDTSDADFLVEFDPDSTLPPFEQYFGLAEALRKTLGRPVDLVEDHEFRNPYLRAL